ncbi:MAG TPA: hypothetical protein VFQ65_19450, partial [Kofleriaceae bacterium]|nr:hypothetical protein [Kofleriaceae bacterium]
MVAAIAALATACHRRDKSPSQHADSPLADPALWDCVRDALKALEASPDHLAAQAKKAVATGDPARIAAWGRDNITVLPQDAAAYAPTTQLWGPRATMRSGAGSARDRADLLAGLLKQAGFEAHIVTWKRPASLTPEVLYRDRDLAFAPDMRLLVPLLERAHRSPKLETGPDQEVAKECHRLADALLATADDQLLAHARALDGGMPDTLPIVEYERDGKKGWAIAYGTADGVTTAPDGLGGSAGDADARDVKLTVSVAVNPPARSTIDRTVPHEVLSAKWPVAAVAGRQVAIGFVPPKDPRPYLAGAADPRKEVKRIAAARLIAGEPLAPGEGAMVVQGQQLSLAGEVASSPASSVAPRNAGSASPQRKTVAEIAVRASASAFPTVTLDVSLSDARGQGVTSLIEADFTVTEDGKPQTISVVRDTVPEGIRVLVLYDTSGSITASWGSAVRRAAFEAQLAKQLTDVTAQNAYLLQVVGLSDTPNRSAWSAPDADQIKTRLGSIGSLSDVWWALGETAPKSGASAVIVVSDFASSLEDTTKIPDYQRHLKASGIPLAIFPIGKVDRKATQLIHELSGCEEIAQDDPTAAEKLARFVANQVKHAATVNYVLEYRAPEQGPAKRTVEVIVKDAAAHPASAEYTVPAAAERAARAGIAGVYLTIELAGRSATRTLAGVPLSYRGTVGDTADAHAIDEATRALNGLHTLAFEPAQPTTSAILHEGLTRLLTLQPIFSAGKRP